MEHKNISFSFERTFNVEKLITLFYMEFSKDFYYEGESHDYWELVYIDKGEMLCTAEKNSFVLRSGELTFHKPGEFHNLSGNRSVAPNGSIINFVCRSKEMKFFGGKIFKLNAEEKAILSMLFTEGLSHFEMRNKRDPLHPDMQEIENAPLGSSQMTKNLLEMFLIKLRRSTEIFTKKSRQSVNFDGIEIPYDLKGVLDFIEENLYGKITVSDIADAVGRSESAVKKLFALYIPNVIINYYNLRKIEEAKRLIREGKYNFTQISYMLNFDTPQYFSKCFKHFTNMTPSEYKASIF